MAISPAEIASQKYIFAVSDCAKLCPLNGTPAFQDAFSGWSVGSQLQTTGGGTGSTDYSTTTAINEGATHRQTFTATKDPVKSIVIDIDVVGTGDFTVTLHNVANDTLGTSTIVNGSMSTGDVTFALASVGRTPAGESFHFHVTTTVADGGVDTNVNNDLEGAEFTVNYAALLSATNSSNFAIALTSYPLSSLILLGL